MHTRHWPPPLHHWCWHIISIPLLNFRTSAVTVDAAAAAAAAAAAVVVALSVQRQRNANRIRNRFLSPRCRDSQLGGFSFFFFK